jgi:hypothetical protein
MKSNIEIYGNVRIVSYDLQGRVISQQAVHNLVPSTGLDLILNRLLSTGTALVPHHFTFGTGTTAAYSTDTGLQSSAYDISFTTPSVAAAEVTFNGSVYSTDGVGSTWNEIGIFTSSSSLVARALIAPLIKTSSSPTNELIAWSFDLVATT